MHTRPRVREVGVREFVRRCCVLVNTRVYVGRNLIFFFSVSVYLGVEFSRNKVP